MDPVDRIIVDQSPGHARKLLIIDSPGLAEEAGKVAGTVSVWCDDLRARAGVPSALLVKNLDAAMFADVDLVWLRLPKGLSALDEYAELIANNASPDVQVIAGGRVKHMTHSMNEVLLTHFGQVTASLGQQKSRVLRAALPFRCDPTWPRAKEHRALGITLVAHGETFAGNKVDPGTALLIKHLSKVPGGDLLDLGSGNGVLATLLARQLGAHDHPGTKSRARVHAVDVSWAAWDATRLTAKANRVQVDARLATNLDDFATASLDAIVSNPPFHRGVAKDSEPAMSMFEDAARVLRPGGEFWCVYNSHLPWKAKLTELIGTTRGIEQNTGYTLTLAVRRGRISPPPA